MDDRKVKTPFRYAGGKYYALKYLLPYIHRIKHDEYREPFVGGGSVFFGKPKAKTNWINDIDAELINIYTVVQDPDAHRELIQLLSREKATKERHAAIKNRAVTSALDRAFKYFYLNRTSYSGIMKQPAWGYREDKSSPPKNWGAMIRDAHAKLQGVKITNRDFSELIEAPSKRKVLLYLDPPYFEADQKRAYTNHFTTHDHDRLARALKKSNHTFLLSYDNIDRAKQMYRWAHIFELSWNYNTSNLKSKERKKGRELLITNSDVFTRLTPAVQLDYMQLHSL